MRPPNRDGTVLSGTIFPFRLIYLPRWAIKTSDLIFFGQKDRLLLGCGDGDGEGIANGDEGRLQKQRFLGTRLSEPD